MTARARAFILRHRTGYGVSSLATPGFRARLLNDTGRNFRKLFKSTPALDSALPAKVGGVGASTDGQVVAHVPKMSDGASHDDGPNRYEQRAAERKEDAGNRS